MLLQEAKAGPAVPLARSVENTLEKVCTGIAGVKQWANGLSLHKPYGNAVTSPVQQELRGVRKGGRPEQSKPLDRGQVLMRPGAG
jgi:hypothetical protein